MQQESWLFRSPDERMIACAIGLFLLVVPGCTRNHYHQAADQDSYNVLHEKTSGRPWQLPPGYSVNAAANSRLFDPSDPDDPMLPHPGPQLYSYQLPQLSGPFRRRRRADPAQGEAEFVTLGENGP